MRKLLALGLVTASLAATSAAYAVPQIGIEIKVDGSIVATQPLTAGGGPFTLAYNTSPFSISVTSTGAPLTPDPSLGTITISVQSTGNHTVQLLATQIGLTGGGFSGLASTFTYNGLLNPGSVTSAIGANYVDAGNTAYAMTTLIGSTPDTGTATTFSSGVINYGSIPASLFSETESYTFTFSGLAEGQSSTQISGVPEPLSLVLLGTGLVGLGTVRSRRRRS